MRGNDEYQSFKLKRNGKDIGVRGDYWKSEGIYLNDICLAVHFFRAVDQNTGSPEKSYTDKDELYAMLRSIGQIAMEHDLMRPIACVISDTTSDIEEIKKWTSDQDWHRGAFSLYVEKDVSERLADLLTPKARVLNFEPLDSADPNEKMLEQFKKQFYSSITMLAPEERSFAQGLGGSLEAIIEGKNKLKPEEIVQEWEKKVIQRGKDIEEGKFK